ncbi:hypothetical protein Tco_0769691 [Tanacetum coccineum]|uniref:Uncharacterized protein n=1 Tax=Tanacetum coccineum TaxID=301880 RepID=A0ABQ4ZDE3_9ASTR
MLIQPQADVGEGSRQPSKPQHTSTTASPSNIEPIPTVASSSHLKKTHKHRKTKRKATEISQFSGPTILVADETVHEEMGDSMERAATTTASLDAEQDIGRQDTILGDRPAQTRFERLSKQSNDPPLSRVNTLGSGEDKESQEVEKKKKARTPQLKRRLFKVRIECSADKSLSDQEDASKQERNIAELDQDERISFDQDMSKLRKPSESGTRKTVPPPQHDPKDKGKAKMIELENPSKKKDQINFDEEMAKRLAEELEAELEEEERMQDKEKKRLT